MKKWLKYFELVGVAILVLIAVSMFTMASEETRANDQITAERQKLKGSLSLDKSQTEQLGRILTASAGQAKLDRENFKSNAVALIEAARRRRQTRMQQISMMLKPEQMEAFRKIRRPKRFDRELSMWVEGLLLNGDQAFTVEGILIEHYNRMEAMRPEGMEAGEGMDRGGRGGGMGDGIGRGGRGGMRGGTGMRGGGGMRGNGSSMMNQLRNKKNKQIKKLLDKDQKKLYKQTIKYLKKQMAERKEQFKNRKNRK